MHWSRQGSRPADEQPRRVQATNRRREPLRVLDCHGVHSELARHEILRRKLFHICHAIAVVVTRLVADVRIINGLAIFVDVKQCLPSRLPSGQTASLDRGDRCAVRSATKGEAQAEKSREEVNGQFLVELNSVAECTDIDGHNVIHSDAQNNFQRLRRGSEHVHQRCKLWRLGSRCRQDLSGDATRLRAPDFVRRHNREFSIPRHWKVVTAIRDATATLFCANSKRKPTEIQPRYSREHETSRRARSKFIYADTARSARTYTRAQTRSPVLTSRVRCVVGLLKNGHLRLSRLGERPPGRELLRCCPKPCLEVGECGLLLGRVGVVDEGMYLDDK